MDLDDYRCTKCACKSEVCRCWDEVAPDTEESLPTDKQLAKVDNT